MIGDFQATSVACVWIVSTEGEFRYQGHLYVLKAIQEKVLRDLHYLRLAVHPGEGKMYHDFSRTYW